MKQAMSQAMSQARSQARSQSKFAAIVSDVHLWVPLCVLVGGVCLLLALR